MLIVVSHFGHQSFSFVDNRNVWLTLIIEQILEAYNTGVEAFRQHKSEGLTADRIDSTMLNMEEVIVLKLCMF